MSTTITVPDIGMYPIEVTINNTKYKLTPGATATVPDGVAALLLGIAENRPKPAEDGWLDQSATLRDVKRMIEESGGGDEPSYEVVAEIQVGEMTVYDEVVYRYEIEGASAPSIPSGLTNLFLNSEENPLSPIEGEGDYAYGFNFMGEGWTGSPGYVVYGRGGDYFALMSDTADLSNTTVRILKAAAEPSGEDEFEHLHGTIGLDPDTHQPAGLTLTETDDEVRAAFAAGKPLLLTATLDMGGGPGIKVVSLCDSIQSYSGTQYGMFNGLLALDDGRIEAMTARVIVSDVSVTATLENLSYKQLPNFDTSSDEGKVLTVTANGLAWVTPQ